MAFKLKSSGFTSPCRATTPLHQNVSTNEAYSLDSGGNLVKTVTTSTPERIIKGKSAPDPVVIKKPGKNRTFDPKGVTYADDCRGIKSGPGRTGTFNCNPPDPKPEPPSEKVITGQGTPDQIIPGSENVVVSNTVRPAVSPPPTIGEKSNIEGYYGRSGIGNIDIPVPEVSLPSWMKDINISRYVRNLIPCKGAGCPDY